MATTRRSIAPAYTAGSPLTVTVSEPTSATIENLSGSNAVYAVPTEGGTVTPVLAGKTGTLEVTTGVDLYVKDSYRWISKGPVTPVAQGVLVEITTTGTEPTIGQGQTTRGTVLTTIAGTTYTTDADDEYLRFTSASPVVVTIPPDVHEVGAQFTLTRGGAGTVTLAPGAGVSIYAPGDSLSIGAPNSTVYVTCVATNVFDVEGQTQRGTFITTAAGTTHATGADDEYIRCTSASPVTVTVTEDVHEIGARFSVTRAGAGTVTLAPGTGVTLNSPGSLLDVAAQYNTAYITCVASNVFDVEGDLA